MSRKIWISIVVIAMTLIASSCGAERSVEAFCETYHSEEQRLIDKYELRSEQLDEYHAVVGLFAGIGRLIEAQGDYVVLLDRLERNAPEEIAPEVAALRDAAKAQAEAMGSGDLMKMGFGGLVTLMQAQGAAVRVDQFIVGNCL